MDAVHIMFVMVGFFIVYFAIWAAMIDTRLQKLTDQQEEYWQRHLKDHPMKGENDV